MAAGLHVKAPHYLPGFLPGPDGADPLFTFVVWFLLNLLCGGLTTGASAWELLGARATVAANAARSSAPFTAA